MIQKVFKAAIMLLKKKFGEEANWVSLSEQIEIPDEALGICISSVFGWLNGPELRSELGIHPKVLEDFPETNPIPVILTVACHEMSHHLDLVRHFKLGQSIQDFHGPSWISIMQNEMGAAISKFHYHRSPQIFSGPELKMLRRKYAHL